MIAAVSSYTVQLHIHKMMNSKLFIAELMSEANFRVAHAGAHE